MEIKLRDEMTLADIRQALFEQLCALEDEYAVRYSCGATLYLNPTNGFGDDVTPRMAGGANCESSTARDRTNALRMSYDLGPIMIKEPRYIGLEEARQILAQMGVQLTLRQM
jgi:hypothetical protein